ncbi:hypothetical protein OU426_00880 [Frigidibacter sp. RF13]|uniref:hypothetical protein n=1 Tax=Frigidibacter sp. RF13 TaxID=2997340 RepID=UPI00226E409B|nr:hypothetical protein [Frigidibacter sp. RF13]MCY1125396.1 hypothetical protein [Frigidibacter sp. RF13]
MQRDFTRVLEIGGWLILGFGLLVAASNLPGLNGTAGLAFDLLFWPPDGAENIAPAGSRLLAAMLGGVAAGWGVCQIGLARALSRSEPGAARRAVLWGYLTWFAVDGAGSLAAGAPMNLIGNTLFLGLLLWPFLGRAGLAAAKPGQN